MICDRALGFGMRSGSIYEPPARAERKRDGVMACSQFNLWGVRFEKTLEWKLGIPFELELPSSLETRNSIQLPDTNSRTLSELWKLES